MAADPRRRARRPGPLDLAFLAVIVAFALWASITTVLTDRPLVEARVYLAVPAVLAGRVLLGRLAAHGADARSAAVRAATVLLCPAGLCLLAARILDSSLYANAQAAAGVQIAALAALLLTSTLRRGAGDRPLGALPAASVLPTASLVLTALAAGLGLALAVRAQAGLMLVLVVVGLSVLALIRPEAVRRRVSAGITTAAIGAALAVVLALSSLPAWPRWLGDDQSLSFARQLLWRDALELWGDASAARRRPWLLLRQLADRPLRAAPVRRALLRAAGRLRARHPRRRCCSWPSWCSACSSPRRPVVPVP